MWKVYDDNDHNDDGQIVIRKINISFQLRWAKKSVNNKSFLILIFFFLISPHKGDNLLAKCTCCFNSFIIFFSDKGFSSSVSIQSILKTYPWRKDNNKHTECYFYGTSTRTLIRPKSGEPARDYLLCSFCLAFFKMRQIWNQVNALWKKKFKVRAYWPY